MKVSIKTSSTTGKQIAVINGRIKVGEVVNGKIITNITTKWIVEAIAAKNKTL